MKKKKKGISMTGVALGSIGGAVIVGATPNLSGTAAETTLKGNYMTGIGNVGKTLPILGKVKGTRMVIKAVNKLKPIKIKGAYKL